MPHVAGEVIDEARGRHSAFDLSRHPNKVVLQYLSGYVRELHGKTAKIDPDVLREEVLTNLPLAVHDDGILLPENRLVVEAVVADANARTAPITIIPASHRFDRRTLSNSAWQVGNRLYLSSPATLWTNYAMVGLALVLTPPKLTTLTGATGTVELPDSAHLALVEATAAFMARRLPLDAKAPLADARQFQAIATAAEEAYLSDILNNLSGKTFLTRDVYRPNAGV